MHQILKDPLSTIFQTDFDEKDDRFTGFKSKNPDYKNLRRIANNLFRNEYQSVPLWHGDMVKMYDKVIGFLPEGSQIHQVSKYLKYKFIEDTKWIILDSESWYEEVNKKMLKLQAIINESPVSQGVDPYVYDICSNASTVPLNKKLQDWTSLALNKLIEDKFHAHDIYGILRFGWTDKTNVHDIVINIDDLPFNIQNSLFLYASNFRNSPILSDLPYLSINDFQPASHKNDSHPKGTEDSNQHVGSSQQTHPILPNNNSSFQINKRPNSRPLGSLSIAPNENSNTSSTNTNTKENINMQAPQIDISNSNNYVIQQNKLIPMTQKSNLNQQIFGIENLTDPLKTNAGFSIDSNQQINLIENQEINIKSAIQPPYGIQKINQGSNILQQLQDDQLRYEQQKQFNLPKLYEFQQSQETQKAHEMQRIRELNGQFDFQNKLEYIQNVQMGYPYQFSSANQIQNSVPMPNISIASQNQIIPQNIDIQTKIELQKQIVIQKKIELKKQIGDLKQMEKQKKKEDQKQLKNQQLKQLRELQKQKKEYENKINEHMKTELEIQRQVDLQKRLDLKRKMELQKKKELTNGPQSRSHPILNQANNDDHQIQLSQENRNRLSSGDGKSNRYDEMNFESQSISQNLNSEETMHREESSS